MSPNVAIVSVVGAVCLLLYGMSIAGKGMQGVAGQRLRHILFGLGKNRLLAAVAGAAVTTLMQSSSATAMMLVGFARAGLIEMPQAVGILLGADVGTTLTVQLIAFRIYDYALLIVAIGAVLILSSKRPAFKDLGEAILGFGLVFLALKIIIDTMAPVRDNALIQQLFSAMADVPLLALFLAALFAAITTSSAAIIGITLVLASNGLMPLAAAVPIVLGANIGTALAVFASSIGSVSEARRVATAHILFKVVGVLLFFPFISGFADLVAATTADPARQVANAHSLFNLAIAVICLPFAGQFARLVGWLIPESPGEDTFKPRYLDDYALESVPLALGQATRETLRMADIVTEMVRDILKVFQSGDETIIEQIEAREDQVDYLEESIKSYLTRLSQQSLTEQQSKQEIGLIYLINELEHIGDIVDKSTMLLARKLVDSQLAFSAQGMKELETMHQRVMENLRSVISAVATRDQELAQKVLGDKAAMNRMERELRQTHIQRLHAGTKESMETSSIHMDVLNDLKRINSHTANMAYVVLGEL